MLTKTLDIVGHVLHISYHMQVVHLVIIAYVLFGANNNSNSNNDTNIYIYVHTYIHTYTHEHYVSAWNSGPDASLVGLGDGDFWHSLRLWHWNLPCLQKTWVHESK